MTRNTEKHESGGGMGYGRFAAMIATSTVVMFGLMYLNTYLLSHVFWSQTRAWMALLMGATMAVIMLGFMLSMYANRAVNIAIFAGSVGVFALSLFLVRSQLTVGDQSYMRAMIPHHSIAIMTSSRADISDPRVRHLADGIIYAQDKEIAEMRYLIADIDANGDAASGPTASPASIGSLADALSTPELALLDPEFLTPDDLARLPNDAAACTFTYTDGSAPVVAVATDGAAIVKVSGDLVLLNAPDAAALATGPTLSADGMSLTIGAPGGQALDPSAGPQEADMTMRIEGGPTIGYRGLYGCGR